MALLTLLSIAILAQASAEPLQTAICNPVGNVEGGVIENFNLRCPTDARDAAELQSYASAVAARTVSPVPLPQRDPSISVNEEIIFHLTEEGWRLPEPTWLIQTLARYPGRAAERGLEGRCNMRLELSPTGLPVQIDTRCQAYRRNDSPRSGGSVFEGNAIAASGNSVWLLPLELETACITSEHDFMLSNGRNDDIHRDWHEHPVEGAPTCPDAT
ncbi:hypothetical protein [Oceanicaulis sp.]|uniref:hypothetical protein n=1 Tax=Oceanicaulis sp. TaxID=1924941 RepID=UPI003BA9F4E5